MDQDTSMEKTTKTFKNGISFELIAGYDLLQPYYATNEPETCDWITDHVRPDWTVIDVGAHIGLYTMILSRLVSDGTVYAYEPSERSRNMLAQNMAHNCNVFDFTNIHMLPVAVGSIAGRSIPATLWLTDGNNDYGKTYGEFNFTTLDNDCIKHSMVSRLDFIKCDVDGWDYDVILGAQETIKRFRPYIIIEVNYALKWRGHNQDDLNQLLESLQYQHRVIDPSLGNWLCWPQEKAIGG
jgi:FkbM family methyltransferase